jgi:hypothetical protein
VIHQTASPIAAKAWDVLVARIMFTRLVASSIAAIDQSSAVVEESGFCRAGIVATTTARLVGIGE